MIVSKLVTIRQLAEITTQNRSNGRRTVFTNGCFDILHAGHVLYLETAKNLGDILIVGLNSDASVKRLKGISRPIVPQEERSVVMAALEAVDYVCLFEEDTPYELIQAIMPDILVKGGDWAVDEIVGADLVLAHGGAVRSLSYEQGISSTSIINRILDSKDNV